MRSVFLHLEITIQCASTFSTSSRQRKKVCLESPSVNYSKLFSTSCEQCDKQFKDLDTLKTHIRYTHNNERRYACDQCGKQFVSSSDLQRHRRIVHEKIRDFKCQKCGKSFQTSTNAKRHFLEVCSGGGGGDSTASHLVHRDTLNNTTSSFTIFKVTPASSFLPTYVQLPSYETE